MGKNINLYLMDGESEKRIKCTISSYPIAVYKIPRSEAYNSKDIDLLNNSGIYFLIGRDDKDEPTVYVGQGIVRKDGLGVIRRALEPHNKLDYWTEALFVVNTSATNTVGATELNYLEHEFCRIAIEAKRYIVVNGNEPNIGDFTEEKESDMKEFILYAKMLIGALGYKFLMPLSSEKTIKKINNKNISDNDIMSVEFYCKLRGADAKGIMTDDGFLVYKESKIVLNETPSCPERIKEKRIEFLKKVINGVLSEDYLFSSPSAASCVVCGTSSNGKTDWKDKNGKSINDYEKD